MKSDHAVVLRVVVVGALLAACGDHGIASNGAPDASAAPPVTPVTPVPPGSATDAAAPPLGVDASVTPYDVVTAPFAVDAGAEVNICWYAPAPANGDLTVAGIEVTSSAITHHATLQVLAASDPHPAAPGYAPCNDGAGSLLVGAQGEQYVQRLPPSTGAYVPPGAWLVIHDHALNPSAASASTSISVRLDTVDRSAVTRWMKLSVNNIDAASIAVPPHASKNVTGSCVANADMDVFQVWSHMHRHGTELDGVVRATNGVTTMLYESTDWQHPKLLDLSSAPVHVAKGETLEWTCDYLNDGTTTVVGGGDAENEMCVMVAYFFSAQPEAPDICVATGM